MFCSGEKLLNMRRFRVTGLNPIGQVCFTELLSGLHQRAVFHKLLQEVLGCDSVAVQPVDQACSLPAHCGLFSIGEDHIEKYQSLDERLIKNKASTFFFQAVGESMTPLVFPNDILVVDRSLPVVHGSVVVAHLDGTMVCKRLRKTGGGGVILSSDNDRHQPIVVSEEMDFVVFGVVRAIARELANA